MAAGSALAMARTTIPGSSNLTRSGRIRKGPAPLNLEIPPYKFLDDEHIVVGVE